MYIERNGYKSYIITKDFFKMRYYGYTRKDAIDMFRKDYKKEQCKVFINQSNQTQKPM
jgi:hypothetical protein